MINIKDIAGRLGRLNEKEGISVSQECGSSVWWIPQAEPNCHTSPNGDVVDWVELFLMWKGRLIECVADLFSAKLAKRSRLQTVERTT